MSVRVNDGREPALRETWSSRDHKLCFGFLKDIKSRDLKGDSPLAGRTDEWHEAHSNVLNKLLLHCVWPFDPGMVLLF